MLPGNFHVIDVAVIVAYLGTVIWFGWRSSHQSASEEGFFLAGRKLGKAYQFFLSFGNATEPQGAVSTASLVLQRGVTGVWFAFQTVFMNPYFWFMNTWFRRVRLVTLADMFEDRLGSLGLSRFYALFQVFVACALLGFGNFVAYKIASSITLKPEAQWTAADRAAVDGYVELKQLEQKAARKIPGHLFSIFRGMLTGSSLPRDPTHSFMHAQPAPHCCACKINTIRRYATHTHATHTHTPHTL